MSSVIGRRVWSCDHRLVRVSVNVPWLDDPLSVVREAVCMCGAVSERRYLSASDEVVLAGMVGEDVLRCLGQWPNGVRLPVSGDSGASADSERL